AAHGSSGGGDAGVEESKTFSPAEGDGAAVDIAADERKARLAEGTAAAAVAVAKGKAEEEAETAAAIAMSLLLSGSGGGSGSGSSSNSGNGSGGTEGVERDNKKERGRNTERAASSVPASNATAVAAAGTAAS
ncbi:unnamed protein product, partial [Pylaiella littoralis]